MFKEIISPRDIEDNLNHILRIIQNLADKLNDEYEDTSPDELIESAYKETQLHEFGTVLKLRKSSREYYEKRWGYPVKIRIMGHSTKNFRVAQYDFETLDKCSRGELDATTVNIHYKKVK